MLVYICVVMRQSGRFNSRPSQLAAYHTRTHENPSVPHRPHTHYWH